jgi:serine/threonine protein kinase
MIGKTISHYTILEKSGEGGMGIVYKAQDTRLGRFVALKFLPQHITNDEVGKRRLVQEAKAASAINHPNVCIIYDVEEADGEQFIAMEYVEGVTLRSKIYESEISLDEAVSYVLQIGEALEEAHSKGVIHRDVKPDNIMVNPKNQVKVMDFGLARLKDAILQSRKSSTVGTLAYMAPEQIQGGEIDHRADIFALGVVLYEMLTRRLPFNAVHEAAMMYSILHEEPEPIQKHLPDAPSELVHILERALEKEPSDRYQSVKEMTIDLRRLRKQSTSSFPATKVGASKTDRNHRRLAAIMFTDMVGYSAMAQQNESLALELLSIHREILRSIFPTFGGKEIGTIGDAFFLEFASALDASQCACEIQRKMFDHNALASGEKKIQIRIGVHLGDVVYVENNVQGDGVNIAARIEPLAEPGGICISEDVARQIRNKIDMPIVKLGKAQLKNIQLPVDIYEIVLPWQKRRVPTTQRIMFSLRRKGVRRFVGAASVLVISSLFILYQKSGKTTLRDDGATNPSHNQTPAESSALHNDDVTVKAAEGTAKESGIVQGKENGHIAIRANAQKDVSSPLNFNPDLSLENYVLTTNGQLIS